MEISIKQRKTDGVWVAKARFELSVREEGESESAARAALEQKVREILEAELHGNDGPGKEDTTQQKINAKLEELRPYWRDYDWMTLDDVIETNGCRGIEYRYEKELVWLYVDFQTIPKFTLVHVPEELFPDGKWFIGNCEKKATCTKEESALWRRHRENKAKYLKELEKEKLEAAKKVDPEREAQRRRELEEERLEREIRYALGKEVSKIESLLMSLDRGMFEEFYKETKPYLARFQEWEVRNFIHLAGGYWRKRLFFKALEESGEILPEIEIDVPYVSEYEGFLAWFKEQTEHKDSNIKAVIRAGLGTGAVEYYVHEGYERQHFEAVRRAWEFLELGEFLDV